MFYLIVKGEKVAENSDFDKLQEMADSEMEGFVVSAEDWNSWRNQ